MKKVGELMKDLGFREGASEEVAKAFIKNLIKQAYGVEVKETFSAANPSAKSPALFIPEQLAFDLGPAFSQITPRNKKLA